MRIKEGSVVASCGLYLAIEEKSLESLTTTLVRALSVFVFVYGLNNLYKLLANESSMGLLCLLLSAGRGETFSVSM